MRKKIICGLMSAVLVSSCTAESKPTISKDFSQPVSGEITVSAYDSMRYKDGLEEAARLFEQRYPGTKINVDTFGSMPEIKTMETEDGVTLSVITASSDSGKEKDYISRLNTNIMGTGGSDLIAADIIPWYQYSDSGYLEDLSLYIENDPDFNKENYFNGIFEASKYKGGLYMLPQSFSFDYLEYDRRYGFDGKLTGITSYKALMEFAETLNLPEETKAFNYLGGEQMFNRMFSSDYNYFIDFETKKVNFTDGYFEELLHSAKEAESRGWISLPSFTQDEAATFSFDNIVLADINEDSTNAVFGFNGVHSLYSYLTKKHIPDGQDNINVAMSTATAGGVNSDYSEIGGIVGDKEGSCGYSLMNGYVMNSQSQNRRLAWEFLKFMLEINTPGSIAGIPVNKEAMSEQARLYITGGLFMPEMDTEMTDAEKQIHTDFLSITEDFVKSITSHIINDSYISEVVFTEVSEFFSGGRSAEETAKIIQDKIQLYMNEI